MYLCTRKQKRIICVESVSYTHLFAEYTDVDAVIALGCVVQGETRHFDFICQGVTQGITQLQIQSLSLIHI